MNLYLTQLSLLKCDNMVKHQDDNPSRLSYNKIKLKVQLCRPIGAMLRAHRRKTVMELRTG